MESRRLFVNVKKDRAPPINGRVSEQRTPYLFGIPYSAEKTPIKHKIKTMKINNLY